MDANQFAGRGKPQGAQNGSSPQQGAKRPSAPIRPVSIKMLKQAEHIGDGILTVNKKEVGQVVICGVVADWCNSASSGMANGKFFGYVIHDGTDKITMKHWYDASQDLEQIPIGQYVRAVGNVKIYNNQPQVTGQAHPCKNLNEFLYHQMDIVSTHLRLHKGPKDLDAGANAAAAAAPNMGGSPGYVPPAGMASPMGAPVGAAAAAGAPIGGLAAGGDKMQPVVNYFRQLGSGAVATLDECHSSLKNLGFSLTDVRSSVQQLMMQGQLLEMQNGYSLSF